MLSSRLPTCVDETSPPCSLLVISDNCRLGSKELTWDVDESCSAAYKRLGHHRAGK